MKTLIKYCCLVLQILLIFLTVSNTQFVGPIKTHQLANSANYNTDLSDLLSLSPQFIQNNKIHLDFYEDNGSIFAKKNMLTGEIVHCVDRQDMIDDQPTDFIPINCKDDIECKSTMLTMKLPLCLEDIVSCESLGITQRTKKYFQKVFTRLQKFDYVTIWPQHELNKIDKTSLAKSVHTYLDHFDSYYHKVVNILREPFKSKMKRIFDNDMQRWNLYMVLITSRSFSIATLDGEIHALAPEIDMLNHDQQQTNCLWKYFDKNNKFCIQTRNDIFKGQELLFDYGNRNVEHLCLNYGIYSKLPSYKVRFINRNNEEIFNVLRDDVIDRESLTKLKRKIDQSIKMDSETRKDLCLAIHKKISIYKKIIPELYYSDSCIVKLLKDELNIMLIVGSMIC
jgi:hypothetical protein